MKKEKKEEEAMEKKEPSLEEEITMLIAERDDFRDKYFRALAEIENTRKRLQKEKIEAQSFAIQNVVIDFLQPFDHFEQALSHAEHASKEIKHWAMGFEMILAQMKQVLLDHGVEPLDAIGQSFDPHFHEAIETGEDATVPPGTVLEQFVRGYKMANRVIRPAKVKVAIEPSNEKKEEGE